MKIVNAILQNKINDLFFITNLIVCIEIFFLFFWDEFDILKCFHFKFLKYILAYKYKRLKKYYYCLFIPINIFMHIKMRETKHIWEETL